MESTWREGFRQHLVSLGRRELTIEAYLRDVDLYARWFEQVNQGGFRPGLLCAPDLREYRAHMLDEQKVKPATWNRKHASMTVFCGWCRAQGYVIGDPMQGVEPVEVQELAPFWLPPDDFRKLRRQLDIEINEARSDAWRRQAIRNRAIAALIMYCGVRPGEVTRMNVSDLLLRDRSGTVRIRAGKGDKYAEIPMGAEARQAMSAWLKVHQAEGALFVGKGSDRLSVRQVERALNQVAEEAGVADFHAHRLRHTFVRRLLVEKNQPAYRVQDLARHASFRTTKRYGQDGREDYAAAVEGL